MMARYRKVMVQVWNDEKFRKLKHHGRYAFMFLLSNPNLTGIGCMRTSIHGLAAELASMELEGEFEAFLKAYHEGILEGVSLGLIKYDPKASFLCLPNFIKHNQPESANVVTSWGKLSDMVPQCELQRWYFQRVKWYLEALSEGYAKAFAEAFPKAFFEAMPEPMPEPVSSEQSSVNTQQTPPTHTHTTAPAQANGNGKIKFPPYKPRLIATATPAAPPEPNPPTRTTMADVTKILALYPVQAKLAYATTPCEYAITKVRLSGVSDPVSFLCEKVKAFADSPAGKQGRFTPFADSWFTGERYNDDPKTWMLEEPPSARNGHAKPKLPDIDDGRVIDIPRISVTKGIAK